MSLDLTKYRTVFIEEATEHLSELSSALLELEKEATNAEAIDLIFRMAHGIKGMAASLEYAPITEVAHRLEDRMAAIRDAGGAQAGDEMALLFRGLETLEAMLGVVRETGESPPADFSMGVAFLEANEVFATGDAGEAPKKKALIP
jgi:two-component system chemotaxis sensor kinase CheA